MMKSVTKDVKFSLTRRALMQSAAGLAAVGVLGGGFASAALAQEGTPKRGGILKVGIGGGSASDPGDPALIAAPATRLLTRQWGDNLVEVGADGTAVGRLAESFSANEDGSVWTFNIRPGVTFHDGSVLSAEDVAETYRRHADETSQSVVAPLMADILEMTTDGLVLTITLKGPNADLPYLMTDYHLPIQPKGGREAPASMIGTGPYKVDVAEPGVRYVLSKFENDWNKDRGFYDGVEIYVMNDMTVRSAALASGQVHMINLIAPKVAQNLAANQNLDIRRTISRAHYAFEAMCNTAPFDNKDLRIALKYAMNREEMLDKILFGFGTIGNDVPVNASYPHYRNVLEQRSFDLEKAAEHYKASGHDGSPIVLHVAEAVFPGAVDCALLWQNSCREAGIPLEVKRVPDDGYWAEVANVEPFVADNYLGRPVQDQLYSVFYKSGGAWNMSRFSNAEFDDLLLQSRGELDQEIRTEKYARMSEILWEEGGVFIPLFPDFLDGYGKTIAGWREVSTDELMGGCAPSLTWFA